MTEVILVKPRSGRTRLRSRGPRRDLTVLEQRRLDAAELFAQGVIPAEIARRVGVRHQIVSQWRKAWRQGGPDALRSGGPAGRRSRLTADQLQLVTAALVKGAVAFGYSTDVWTLPRVAEIIHRVTGVAYHPHHVWHLLREQLHWSWQRPARRAIERDEGAIHTWVDERWPDLKKRHSARTR
jgi:transposase